MVTLLAKIFIKDSEDKIKQREAYGMLCGVVGMLYICSTVLPYSL